MASYATSRCCPSKFDEFFRSLDLRKAHTDMLERGPFGALLNLEGLKLHKAILTVLVRCWIPESRAFQIGGILLPFEVRDLALALGLSLVGDRIRIDWDSTEEVEGWRFSGAWARFSEIADVIRAESRSDEIASVHATVRHLLLLLCCCVLFARADPVDHRTKSCLFPYLGAEAVGRIAWAYPVYDFLVDSLDSYSKNGKTGYITGCAIVLQVWLFEHTTLWAPSAPDAHPRLLKWITGIDTRRTDHAAFIRQIRDGRLKKTQVVRCLLPLPREEGLLSFTADEADTVMGEKEASATAPTVEECLQDIRILEEETIASLSDMLRKRSIPFKGRTGRKRHVDREVKEDHVSISKADFDLLVERVRDLERRSVRHENEIAELKRIIASGGMEAESQDEGKGEMMEGDDGGVAESQDEGKGEMMGRDDGGVVVIPSHDSLEEEIKRNVISIPDSPLKPVAKVIWSIERGVRLRLRKTKPSKHTTTPYMAFGTKKVNDKALLVADPQCHRLLPKLLALPPSERVIQVNDDFLCAEDLVILNNPNEWLSSPIMNVYAEYLNVRDENKRKPAERACVAISTFLFDCLTNKEYTGGDSLMKYVKRLNDYPPDTLKRVLFPLHVPNHWILLVLDMVDEKFYIFNSLREQIYYRDVLPLIRYLERLYISMWDFDVSKFRVVEVEKRPLQLNSNDCGLFVLKEMDCLARDVPPEFSQADIALMRRQLFEDFLEGRCGTVLNL
ncbi:uncharacterized protein LOC143890441 [Tasmannia lanceolata]|uniref:uncharacterized protein LOC143858692 n=1 Tax=Tasmannia lanceolata TaxID=3420 RepID=UPI004063B3D4